MQCLTAFTIAVVCVFFVSGAPPAAAAERIEYRPPVAGPIIDPYREPEHDYAAGNRGLDLAASPGEAVRAAADGVVVFSGQVAGALHVVLLHADGLRSTLSFLSTASVFRGQRVERGEVVGTAAGPVHFGIRSGEEYLDPTPFLRGSEPQVHLAPLGSDDVGEAHERSALAGLVRAVGGTGARVSRLGVAWARRAAISVAGGDDTMRAWLSVAHTLAVPEPLRLAMATRDWYQRSAYCTPRSTAPPPREHRRLAILVGGLGSSGPNGASVFDFDSVGAGYRDDDVVRFSYLGGDARERPYAPSDTQQPIVISASRLAATVRELASKHPGVPIDLIAHSQGGLVSRAALALAPDSPLPVSTFVTLGTPHGGASLATAGALFRSTRVGDAILDAAGLLNDGGIDPQSVSVRELAEGSDLVRWLGSQQIPAKTRVVSVAARTDVVVPSPDCRLAGAANTVVTVGGAADALAAHDALPRSPQATREVALAVAGMPPTCESLADALTDTLIGDGIEVAEDTVAAVLGTAP